MVGSNQVSNVASSVVTPVALSGFKTPLLNEFEGASAAYSLRRLKSWEDGSKVVRVRRATDNEEKDFSSVDVANGTMENWVNAYTDLPLDVDSGAAAAYSLRNLKASYTGNVVEVRRSSDDAVKSFTASEVSDGTLEAWVGAGNDGHVRTWYDQSGSGNNAVQTTAANQPKIVEGGNLFEDGIYFDGTNDELNSPSFDFGDNPNTIFTLFKSNDLASAAYILSLGAVRNLVYYNAAAVRLLYAGANLAGGTMSPNQELWSAFFDNPNDTGTLHVNGTQEASGSIGTNVVGVQTIRIGASNGGGPLNGWIKEIIIYNSDQSDNRTAIEANVGDYYGIDLPAGVDSGNNEVDGFVTKWYDQSGNGNDAVQTTAANQPKIVDSGSLLADGIDFDGTDDFLSINFGAALSQPNSIFMVHTSDTATDTKNEFFDSADSTPRTLFDQSGDYYRMFAGTDQPTSLTVDANQKTLVGAFYNTTSSFLSKNGTVSSTLSVGTSSIDDTSNIGYSALGGRYYDGSMQEFIIYNSDQSSNRTGIEANIADEYGITLS